MFERVSKRLHIRRYVWLWSMLYMYVASQLACVLLLWNVCWSEFIVGGSVHILLVQSTKDYQVTRGGGGWKGQKILPIAHSLMR